MVIYNGDELVYSRKGSISQCLFWARLSLLLGRRSDWVRLTSTPQSWTTNYSCFCRLPLVVIVEDLPLGPDMLPVRRGTLHCWCEYMEITLNILFWVRGLTCFHPEQNFNNHNTFIIVIQAKFPNSLRINLC